MTDNLIISELAKANLTINEVKDTLMKGAIRNFNTRKDLRFQYEDAEDLAHNVLCYYLQPMKSTGEIRILHYLKHCNYNRQHIINVLNLTITQEAVGKLRSIENDLQFITNTEHYKDACNITSRQLNLVNDLYEQRLTKTQIRLKYKGTFNADLKIIKLHLKEILSI